MNGDETKPSWADADPPQWVLPEFTRVPMSVDGGPPELRTLVNGEWLAHDQLVASAETVIARVLIHVNEPRLELERVQAARHELSMRCFDEELARVRAADAGALEEERAAHAVTKRNLGKANTLIEQLRAGERESVAGCRAVLIGTDIAITPAGVRDALHVLKEALDCDRQAIHQLLQLRVPCNEQLAEHPTVQVRSEPDGSYTVGALGLINGIFGLVPDGRGLPSGYGWIASETDNDAQTINRFVCTADFAPREQD